MRPWVPGLASLAGIAILACGSGGKSDTSVATPPPGPIPTFQCSDSPAAMNQVVLRCGVKQSSMIWGINAVIGVPTTSTDINGFVFDVVFDPHVLAFVPDSAHLGNFFMSAPDPPLLDAALDPIDPGRLVVGIIEPGGIGVAGTAGQDLILTFKLSSLTTSPFGPDLIQIQNFRAVDSQGNAILGITSSDQLMLSFQ